MFTEADRSANPEFTINSSKSFNITDSPSGTRIIIKNIFLNTKNINTIK